MVCVINRISEERSLKKILLVASSGGHLYQLHSLKNFWGSREHCWVSFPSQDSRVMLEKEKVYWAHYPTNRSIKNLFKNLVLAVKIIRKERPSLIISTGAGVAVPFIVCGFIMRVKTVYLESITRNEKLSLSALLIYPFVSMLLVQWPQLAARYKKARYEGRII